jgi:hypothetical protein
MARYQVGDGQLLRTYLLLQMEYQLGFSFAFRQSHVWLLHDRATIDHP